MKIPEFPKTVARGNCSVTIYETPSKGYMAYTLVYYQDKKRERETSADYLAIRTRADEVLADLNEGRPVEAGALKASERSDYLRAVDILKPTGQPFHVAASHYAEAVKILGSDLVIEAAREYAGRHLNKGQLKTVAQAAEEYIAEKERREQLGKLSSVHVGRLTARLRAFAKAVVMNTASVTAQDIDRFLDGLENDGSPVSPRTRDNWASEIVAFYEWAKLKRYVPAGFDEPGRITRLDDDQDGMIEIYTPEEIGALLAAAGSELVPFLAIGAFAGLRSSEIMRLDWADVRMENGSAHIVVQKGKVKKRNKSRRIVPMSENLKAWLKLRAAKSGPVWPHSEPLLYKILQKLAPEAGLEWKSNALRHSCISYRVALVKNVPQVALECGNSQEIIFSNYRELVTEQDAQRWFSIMPEPKRSRKIITLATRVRKASRKDAQPVAAKA